MADGNETAEGQKQFRMSRSSLFILRLLVLKLSCRLCAARKEPGGRPSGVHVATWKLCFLVALPVAAAALVVALIVCVCRWKNKDAPVEAVESRKKAYDNPMSINPTMVRSAHTTPVRPEVSPFSPPTATTSPSNAPRRLRSPSQARSSPLQLVPLAHQGRIKRQEKKAAVVKDPLACYSPAISVLLAELDYQTLELGTNGGFGWYSLSLFARRGGPWQVKDTKLVQDQGLPAKVVIKRHNRIFSEKECERIREELKSKFTLRHMHLVSLLGFSLGKGRLYLVYDRMSMGSLERHLFPDSGYLPSSLDWTARHRIAKEVAQGLDPLHISNLPHGSISASTIMLDHYYTVHLDDHFHYQPDMSSGGASASTAETDASLEGDIADLGAVILELVCGRRRADAVFSAGNVARRLVDWVWAIYGEAFSTQEPHKRDEVKENCIFDAVDPVLKGEINRSQASKLLILGLACSHPDLKLRPKIRYVREVLLDRKPVPQLPLSKPTCE